MLRDMWLGGIKEGIVAFLWQQNFGELVTVFR
jgi:hypothetical protein